MNLAISFPIKALEETLKKIGGENRFCLGYANFKLKYKGKALKVEQWKAARSTIIQECNHHA